MGDDEAPVPARELWCGVAFLVIIAIGLGWIWLDQQIYHRREIASKINHLPQRSETAAPAAPAPAGGDLPAARSIVGVGGPIPDAAKIQDPTPAGVDTPSTQLRGSLVDEPVCPPARKRHAVRNNAPAPTASRPVRHLHPKTCPL